ncbi:MutS-related protein [Thermanaerovibrio acidaminovorans]|uniref:MutS-related protein n=3 Tax=Thermanaerovibrio acidaminovorans TaxID=81462 RepID=UPI0001A3CFA1|nr:DNA mismatch repair protein MutS [Thermanaerovibrio acidaminovorans]
MVRRIYRITLEYLERKAQQWLCLSPRHASPSSVLSGSQRLLEASLDLLEELRRLAREEAHRFPSAAFGAFFDSIGRELDDDYMGQLRHHVKALGLREGVTISARLGMGNEGTGYALCEEAPRAGGLLQRALGTRAAGFSFDPRDEGSFNALGDIRDRAVLRAARVATQGAGHVEGFFTLLRFELAFYLGCANLHRALTEMGLPVTFPIPDPMGSGGLSCRDLYHVSMALENRGRAVGNRVRWAGSPLMVITGVNRGGKTTFLRGLGLAQLMMQAGMFVGASHMEAELASGIFSHFRQEEDASMRSGKFEEELTRLEAVVDALRPGGLLLLNESLSATNEREGSAVAQEILKGLLDRGIRVAYVTHLHQLVASLERHMGDRVLFLSPERLEDGTRTFRLMEGPPRGTGFGVDLYRRIMGS